MSSDSADDFEWTSPADRTPDRDGGERGSGGAVGVEVDGRVGVETDDRVGIAVDGPAVSTTTRDGGREPTGDTDQGAGEFPPAPVLAGRVDELRTERDALESQLDATRTKYERMLAARNDEISELRREADPTLLERVRGWLTH